ncbi:MAG: calcium-binding protein [Rhizobiaceae bacterium]|nr:calcium-binding protein [Rhizobiaceae bacterium]
MKTVFIDYDTSGTFFIDSSRRSWLFENGHLFTSASGPAISALYRRNSEIILEGHAETTSRDAFGAIDSLGRKTTVIVTETGSIDARHTGIALHGKDSEIDNRGSIWGDYHGVYATGEGLYLSNMGFIGGNTVGVYMRGDQSVLTNHDVGEIRGSVSMAGAAGETLWFNNYGKVTSPVNAIVGGDSNDIIHNTGTLGGFVSLGAGNDVLDTRWGQLWIARVVGGDGDDTLIVSDASYRLNEVEYGGNDTVKSTVSYTLSANVENLVLLGRADIAGTGHDGDNRLVGNKVDNALDGLGGDDILDGRRGNDVLTGGEGCDTFVFGSCYDMDTITDFTHGQDTIDLSGWKKVGGFNALLRRAEDHGDDLWIIAGKDMLVIEGQNKADMHAHDFIF